MHPSPCPSSPLHCCNIQCYCLKHSVELTTQQCFNHAIDFVQYCWQQSVEQMTFAGRKQLCSMWAFLVPHIVGIVTNTEKWRIFFVFSFGIIDNTAKRMFVDPLRAVSNSLYLSRIKQSQSVLLTQPLLELLRYCCIIYSICRL